MLTDDQLRRYAKNILLPEIGREGQEKLLRSKVLVVGAGGLGSPLLSYLAVGGVGTLGIIDHDRVELSNLQRQILHETADIGSLKVESARDRIEELNPDVTVHTYPERLTAENAAALVSRYDVIADGSDNFDTRYALADTCYQAGKPLVSAAIAGFSGQLSTFKAYLGEPHPCYRCFCPEAPERGPSCAIGGVTGAFAGALGSLQALEVIKELLGIGSSLSGSILMVDGLTATTRTLRLPRDPACKTCGEPLRHAARLVK
ncbi:MAG: HesA/MoeB/ThiF family protein [Alphaproteobacteria bacterium]|nr:HesA/MoeB/ThiF family protein [Alphaproteobacteria bacterium]